MAKIVVIDLDLPGRPSVLSVDMDKLSSSFDRNIVGMAGNFAQASKEVLLGEVPAGAAELLEVKLEVAATWYLDFEKVSTGSKSKVQPPFPKSLDGLIAIRQFSQSSTRPMLVQVLHRRQKTFFGSVSGARVSS